MNKGYNKISWLAVVLCLVWLNSALADDSALVAKAMQNNKVQLLTLGEKDEVVNSCKHDGVFEVRRKGWKEKSTLVCNNGKATSWSDYPPKLDGRIEEWEYINGLADGMYADAQPNQSNDLKTIREYKKGQLDGELRLISNGRVVFSSVYKQGQILKSMSTNPEGYCVSEYKKEIELEKCYDDTTKKLLWIDSKVQGKSHGYYRLYDDDGSLLEETLHKHGKFVRAIVKKEWFHEYRGEKVYFDVVSKIENGNCVYRKLSDGKELGVYAIDRGRCQ